MVATPKLIAMDTNSALSGSCFSCPLCCFVAVSISLILSYLRTIHSNDPCFQVTWEVTSRLRRSQVPVLLWKWRRHISFFKWQLMTSCMAIKTYWTWQCCTWKVMPEKRCLRWTLIFQNIEDPFEGLETAHKQERFYKVFL